MRALKLNRQTFRSIPLRELWIATGFALFLITFEAIYFQINHLNFLLSLYSTTGKLQVVFVTLVTYFFTFVAFVIVIWLSLRARYSLRVFYLIILAVPLLTQYGYWNANQAFMNLHDFDLTVELGAEAGPWKEHLSLINTYINFAALIPIIIYAILLASVRSFYKHDVRLFLIVIYGVLFVNSGIFWYKRLSADHLGVRTSSSIVAAPSWSGFVQVVTEAFYERLILHYVINYYGPRNSVSFVAASQPRDNIVLIIDESVRADHLSLNGYERDTTPYLEKLALEQTIYNWGTAASASTCSNQSVAALLTGVNTFPDIHYQVKLNPTIFDYAKAMNYKTVLFDSEGSGPRYHFGEDIYQVIDQFEGTAKFGTDYENDIKLARSAAELLTDSTGNFVVLMKRGLHFPYNSRYPADEALWTPVLANELTIMGNRENLVNSYDNAILYNSNNFFQALLADPEIFNTTTFIYTSDHGQTLSDNGETHTHCKNTKKEAAVPLLMITSNAYSIDEWFQASHHNIFATLLDLMNFPASERHYEYEISLLKAKVSDSKPRYYLYGSLYGIGTYEVVKFD